MGAVRIADPGHAAPIKRTDTKENTTTKWQATRIAMVQFYRDSFCDSFYWIVLLWTFSLQQDGAGWSAYVPL